MMMEHNRTDRQKRKEEGKRRKRERILEFGGKRPRPKEEEEEKKKNSSSSSAYNDDNPPQQQQHQQTPQSSVYSDSPSRYPLPTLQGKPSTTSIPNPSNNSNSHNRSNRNNSHKKSGRRLAPPPKHHHHQFGKVMESVPCRNQPRYTTLSIAIPGSIVSNCQTKELRTQLVGQIARYATIYHVDEIVVYNDTFAKPIKDYNHHDRRRQHQAQQRGGGGDSSTAATEPPPPQVTTVDPHAFMAKLLQYCECPQYLRRHFFPMHTDLQYVGLLPPIDAPHHVRVHEKCKYREGVVLSSSSSSLQDQATIPTTTSTTTTTTSTTTTPQVGSLVNCGIRNRPVHINMTLPPGIRCTVELDPSVYDDDDDDQEEEQHSDNKHHKKSSNKYRPIPGRVVAPSAPRQDNGMYWGYTVRMADSLKSALEDCPFHSHNIDDNEDKDGGYDLKIGTSERARDTLDDAHFQLFPSSAASRQSHRHQGRRRRHHQYKHAIIVFGGVAGIEECVDADETLRLPGSQCHTLFDVWVNICPYQGSRTIRTEEAVLITLAKLSSLLVTNEQPQEEQEKGDEQDQDVTKVPEPVVFSDNPSEESSTGDEEEEEE
jgi:predicted SPOUT superfamily RNA methylase MTH1